MLQNINDSWFVSLRLAIFVNLKRALHIYVEEQVVFGPGYAVVPGYAFWWPLWASSPALKSTSSVVISMVTVRRH